MPLHIAVRTGLVTPDAAGKARNDIRGFNGFCHCEGLVNTTHKEDTGCACFRAPQH
ncbi:MAG: hypothetical protein HYU60_05210 [Magnetospirillum sp.]|nr:hypothetical protein [Magnetospirillum sp.]